MSNYYLLPKTEDLLRNCGRHVYKKLGRCSNTNTDKCYEIKQCVYCKHEMLVEEK